MMEARFMSFMQNFQSKMGGTVYSALLYLTILGVMPNTTYYSLVWFGSLSRSFKIEKRKV